MAVFESPAPGCDAAFNLFTFDKNHLVSKPTSASIVRSKDERFSVQPLPVISVYPSASD